MKESYCSIRDFFNPRQKWLTKKIPRSWADKVWLIQLVAFESIIHFIEKEEAFERIEWSATPEHKEAAEAFSRAYKYVKIQIPILEDKIAFLWKDKDLVEYISSSLIVPLPNQEGVKNKTYELKKPFGKSEDVFAQIRENESKIEWMTQEVVEIVAKYRNFMWT